MRKAAAIVLSFLLCSFGAVAQSLDSKLEQYFSILENEPAQVKIEECDALIEAAKDSSLRQTIALKIFDHYKASALMGDEAVAIYLTDKWFAPGKVAMRSNSELFEAKFFAEVNRQSLIGKPAPKVLLQDPYGELVSVPESSEGPVILYFYDTDCAKCKLETATLRSLLNDKDYPVELVAVYVGTNEDKWKDWRETYFSLDTEETEVIHLWDPEGTADLQFKYGVVQTPRMFLVDHDGIIVGRGLDTGALEQMLDVLLDDGEYHYGSLASEALFEKLFSTYGPEVAATDVQEIAGILKARTLDLGDTLSFKHLEGDLLYYLVSRREEGFREGSAGFIDEYVLSRPDIWNTEDDTLMVVGMAKMLDGLLSRTPVGSRIPRMPVKGWNRFRRKGGYLFFHAEGCSICESEMAMADSLGIDYFSVNMDALEEDSPKKASRLLNTFDLSGLPFVMEIGKGGIVKRRYTSLVGQLSYFDEKE